jgi:nitrogen fixation protein FixH
LIFESDGVKEMKTRRTAAVLAVILLIAACSPPPTVVTVAGEGWRAELAWTSRPVALRPVTLRLKLTDGGGHPLPVGDLSAKANMPEMPGCDDTVRFIPGPDGVFEAVHAFSMDGAWMIQVEWKSGSRSQSAQFPIQVGDR